MSNFPNILIVAGEASGDAHGAELIRALREQRPDLRITGCGGSRMRTAGQEQLFDLTEHAVVGLMEVLRHYFKFKRLFERVVRLAKKDRPEAIVLIDYPGFNLRLATRLRNQLPETKFIYYISPQVWAWKSGRARTMARVLDLLLVIFPFEKTWFAQRNPRLKTEWVGHPMLERLLPEHGAVPEPRRICLLPGSRSGEIRRHLPVLWAAARLLEARRPGHTFVWLAPDARQHAIGQEILKSLPAANFAFESYDAYAASHVRRCSLVWVASGTASLECAVEGVPQIMFYRVNPLTYWVARRVVKLPFISMVNILAQEAVVPELIQEECNPQKIVAWTEELLGHPSELVLMKEKMRAVVEGLGGPGASQRAATAILREMRL